MHTGERVHELVKGHGEEEGELEGDDGHDGVVPQRRADGAEIVPEVDEGARAEGRQDDEADHRGRREEEPAAPAVDPLEEVVPAAARHVEAFDGVDPRFHGPRGGIAPVAREDVAEPRHRPEGEQSGEHSGGEPEEPGNGVEAGRGATPHHRAPFEDA